MADNVDGPREVAQALLEKAEAGRLERGSALEVRELTTKQYGEGNFAVFGFVSSYSCNLKFLGRRRTVHCTCEDFARTQGSKGPCKHLVALAKAVAK
jgi:predicted nucleic acid-binding Zn finger protein